MARGRRPRRFRFGDGRGDPDPALSRPAPDGDHASDRPRRPRQRIRRLGDDLLGPLRHNVPGLRPGRDLPGRRLPRRRLHSRSLATVDVHPSRRHAHRAGGVRAPGRRRGGRRVEAPLRRGAGGPGGPAVSLRARLSLPAPRKSGLPVRGRSLGRWGAPVPPVRRSAGDRDALDRNLRALARVVSQLSLRRGARARTRLHRGPRIARHPPLRPRPRRRHLAHGRGGSRGDPRRRKSGGGPGGASQRREAAARRVPEPARAFGRRLPGAPRRGADGRRRVSVVHRLGPGHVHRASRSVPGDGPARRSRADPRRVGRRRLGRDASEPLSRRESSARVQLGRRLALVSDRRARVFSGAGRRRTARRRGRAPESRGGFRGNPGRLRPRHAIRDPGRRRRAARRRGSRASS